MPDLAPTDHRVTLFEGQRPRLLGLAYRMLGTVHDAEDIIEESWLRWHHADVADVRNAETWLVAVVTRLCIERLRRAAIERETYEGSWLPEPVVIGGPPAAHAVTNHDAGVASDFSLAVLLLLEQLAPEERAAFLLRDVFDAGYGEIARVVERSEAACRQMVHRARERVRERHRRFTAPPGAQERLLERFLAALRAGDQRALAALFADEATFMADGGGKVQSVRNVVHGAARLAKLIVGDERKGRGVLRHRIARLNGDPAILTSVGGTVHAGTVFEADGERIHGVYRVLDPDKLRHVETPVALA